MLDARAGLNQQLMRHKVKLDVERTYCGRNDRGAESPRGDVERDILPMVLERRKRHAGLAHNLSPHVQRVARAFPFGKGERGPIGGVHKTGLTCPPGAIRWCCFRRTRTRSARCRASGAGSASRSTAW